MVCLTEDSTTQEYQYYERFAQCARLYSLIKEERVFTCLLTFGIKSAYNGVRKADILRYLSEFGI